MLLALLPLAGGCHETLRPATGQTTEPAAANPASPREYWDAYFFDDTKVGHAHIVYTPTSEQGRPLVRIRGESSLQLQRFGQTIRQRLEFSSVETPEGELVRCASKMASDEGAAGAVELTAEGEVVQDQLVLRISSRGKPQTASIPWDRTWGGFFAMEQTLERQPLQPGEQRRIRALTPGFNQVADVEFRAVGFESTPLLEGPQELLRIEAVVQLGDNRLEQTVWADREGQTRKTFMPALKQTTYRTSREKALGKSEAVFDLGEQTIVRVTPPIERPHATRKISYRIKLKQGDVRRAFAQGATQSVRVLDDQTADVTVRALRPGDRLDDTFPGEQPPQAGDRETNSLIQCDDPLVQQLAAGVVPDKSPSWEVAVGLERQVRDYVANKGFAQALASAADVVRSREGDCTEHAVLLAALCRARQIPSRVAIGLVYSSSVGGFAYHMWTEVWIEDRWLPLDGTLGLAGIGAAHLKVSHSDLKGVDPFTQFLPVFQLLGNLQIEVLSVE